MFPIGDYDVAGSETVVCGAERSGNSALRNGRVVAAGGGGPRAQCCQTVRPFITAAQ